MSEEALEQQAEIDDLIVEALAGGATQAAAAELAGVSARTVRRRMSDPAFARSVSERRGERISDLTGQMIDASFEAVRTLREALDAEAGAERLRAAQLLLTLVLRYRADQELEARLAAVEGALDEQQAMQGKAS